VPVQAENRHKDPQSLPKRVAEPKRDATGVVNPRTAGRAAIDAEVEWSQLKRIDRQVGRTSVSRRRRRPVRRG